MGILSATCPRQSVAPTQWWLKVFKWTLAGVEPSHNFDDAITTSRDSADHLLGTDLSQYLSELYL